MQVSALLKPQAPTCLLQVVNSLHTSYNVTRISSEASFYGGSSPGFWKLGRCKFRISVGRKKRGRLLVNMSLDYYSILGLTHSATKQDIKNSYRQLARMYHPDVSKDPAAEEKFKEISAAYEVLSDDEKRAAYDQFGEVGINGSGLKPGFHNPFDLFESMFGEVEEIQRRRSSSIKRGDDLQYTVELEFAEAIFGTQKVITVHRLVTCAACNGSGAKSNKHIQRCNKCGGKGQVYETKQMPFGSFSQISTCPTCRGKGEKISEYCYKCYGKGCIEMQKEVQVQIPPGVTNDTVIQVPGQGDVGRNGGPPGNLYVLLDIRSIPGIEREGVNFRSTISISYLDAILGTTIEVNSIEGVEALKVPPGSQPGEVLVLRGLGAPKLNNSSVRGDHLFVVNVTIPKRLTVKERQLLEQLAELQMVAGWRNNFNTNTRLRKSVAQDEKQYFWSGIRKLFGSKGNNTRFGSISLQLASINHSGHSSSLVFIFLALSLLTIKFMSWSSNRPRCVKRFP